MNNIALKSYFFDECLVWLLILAGISSTTLIFICFDIPREDRFILSTCIIGAECYFVFFLNRFEPKNIKLFEEEFEVVYFNQKYFEKPVSIYSRTAVKVVITKDIILLSDKGGTITKIRKKALNQDDWDILKSYFDYIENSQDLNK